MPFEDVDLLDADPALGEALEREGGGWALDRVRDAGVVAGSAEAREHGAAPSATSRGCRPTIASGGAIDQVDLDPSWHWLLRGAIERGIHALPWRDPRPARTSPAPRCRPVVPGQRGRDVPGLDDLLLVPALRRDPALAAEWEPRLTRPTTSRRAVAGWR